LEIERKMKRTSVIIAALAMIAIACAAFAVGVLVTKQVGMNFRIKGTVSMGVFDTDGSTVMTAIQFGDLFWYDALFYPGRINSSVEPAPTSGYWVKNLDQTNMTIRFTALDMPLDVRISVACWRQDQAPANDFHEIYGGLDYTTDFILTSPSLDPTHPLAHNMQFTLLVNVRENTPFATYAPMLKIDGMEVV